MPKQKKLEEKKAINWNSALIPFIINTSEGQLFKPTPSCPCSHTTFGTLMAVTRDPEGCPTP